MCSECQLLIKAIDAYITKADNDLADRLKEEGYADSKNTVKHIEELEEKIAEVLQEQSKDFEDLNPLIRKVLTLRNFLKVHGRNLRQQMISGKSYSLFSSMNLRNMFLSWLIFT